MNAKAPILGLLLVTILAGCTGLPDDAARLGDKVTMHLEVRESSTGLVLIDTNGPTDQGGAVELVLGDPEAGVSFHLERELIGAQPGDIIEKTIRADERIPFVGTVNVELEQGRSAVVVETSLSRFQSRYGEPMVGATLHVQPESGQVSYPAMVISSTIRDGTLTASRVQNGSIMERVEGHENTTTFDEATKQAMSTTTPFTETRYVEAGVIYNENFTGPESREVVGGTVTYHVQLDGAQRDADAAMYGGLVSVQEGNEIVRRLDPTLGFVYAATPTFNPLGLPQTGSYKVLDVNSTHMVLGFNPKVLALLEAQDVDIRVEVVDVTRIDQMPAEGEPWTARPSPVIARDPLVQVPVAPEPAPQPEDDHGHTH